MLKVLFKNEDNCLECIYVNRFFIDPEAPTDIVIVSGSNYIRLRLQFTDIDEANSFMEVLFEGDKINLAQISEDLPEFKVVIEEEDDITGTMLGLLDPDMLDEFYEQMGYEDDEDGEEA